MQMTHGMLGFLLGVTVCTGCPSVPHQEEPAVRPGLEVLLSDSIYLVRGKRVGLVTNQAGVDARGISGVDRLVAAGVDLVALFSPEHGFRGTDAPGAAVTSTVDSATGLPIYSLYGRNSAPTDSMLAGIDLLLVDLQDVGARYYTYLWTTIGVMQAAARHGIEVIVLDRPNPIGGAVQGNVLDTAYRSPVGMLAVPMRHGMTLGELALLARHDLGLSTEVVVVPVAGWRRGMYFDQTGLPFVPPSPNLLTLEALMHYPGLCLFEGTVLSVGRGTAHPFEQVGAPWLDTALVLERLRSAGLEGVAFSGVRFTPVRPGDGRYADTSVAGIRLTVVNRDRYDPTRVALALLDAIEATTPMDILVPNARHLRRLYGGTGLDRLLDMPQPSPGVGRWEMLEEGWAPGLQQFRARRDSFLLYPP
jgi:uncharacterized protein YbbC (DUF1343 family)